MRDLKTTFPTWVALAAALGVDRSTLQNWSKLDGAPKPRSNGVHVLRPWQEFILKRELKSAPIEDTKLLKDRILRAKAERAEFENEVRKKQFIHIDDVKHSVSRTVSAFKSKMLSIPSTQCQIFAHLKDPIEIDGKLTTAIRSALRELSEHKWNSFCCPHCRKEIEA